MRSKPRLLQTSVCDAAYLQRAYSSFNERGNTAECEFTMFVVRVFTVLLLFGILSEGTCGWVGLMEYGYEYVKFTAIVPSGIGACVRCSYDLSVTDVTATSAVLHWKIGNKARKRSRDREVRFFLFLS